MLELTPLPEAPSPRPNLRSVEGQKPTAGENAKPKKKRKRGDESDL
jgi:hypothetical protein